MPLLANFKNMHTLFAPFSPNIQNFFVCCVAVVCELDLAIEIELAVVNVEL